MQDYKSVKVLCYINELKNTCKLVYKDETIYCKIDFNDNTIKNDVLLHAKHLEEPSSYNYVVEGELVYEDFICGSDEDTLQPIIYNELYINLNNNYCDLKFYNNDYLASKLFANFMEDRYEEIRFN